MIYHVLTHHPGYWYCVLASASALSSLMQGLPLDRLTRYRLFFSLFFILHTTYYILVCTYEQQYISDRFQQSGVAKSDHLHVHFSFIKRLLLRLHDADSQTVNKLGHQMNMQ